MAAPAAGQVRVSAKPSLYPSFQPGVTSYVSRCQSGSPLRLAVRASGGDRVAVRLSKGRFSARVEEVSE